MKKFIRYLYEYQNGRQVQNVGFVRVEESVDSAVIQIYGKGFPVTGNESLEILLFYLQGDQCVGISMGKVTGAKPMFGYRLYYTQEDVGGMEIFPGIEGIILLSEGNGQSKWYGGIWNERSVNVENMIRREELLREREPGRREEVPDYGTKEKESGGPEETDGMREMPEAALDTEEDEEPIDAGETAEAADENRELDLAGEREPETSENAEYADGEKSAEWTETGETARENADSSDELYEDEWVSEEPSAAEADTGKEDTGKEDVIYKITRQDLVRLPRREWKLANNNFLLHGYHNYHHLVSFEKEGRCWLGVPGIYHPREQRAAQAFGFGQFMKPDEGEVELTASEADPRDDFGYWCRAVSTVIAHSEQDMV